MCHHFHNPHDNTRQVLSNFLHNKGFTRERESYIQYSVKVLTLTSHFLIFFERAKYLYFFFLVLRKKHDGSIYRSWVSLAKHSTLLKPCGIILTETVTKGSQSAKEERWKWFIIAFKALRVIQCLHVHLHVLLHDCTHVTQNTSVQHA